MVGARTTKTFSGAAVSGHKMAMSGRIEFMRSLPIARKTLDNRPQTAMNSTMTTMTLMMMGMGMVMMSSYADNSSDGEQPGKPFSVIIQSPKGVGVVPFCRPNERPHGDGSLP